MGLAILRELQAVFEVAQESVSGNQTPVLSRREQVLIGEARQSQHGSTMPDPWNLPATQALQALHEKFKVPNAAGSELDIEGMLLQPPAAQFLADALARGGDCLDGAEVERGGIDQRLGCA